MINLNLQLFASYNSKKYNVADAVKSYGNAIKSDFTYDPTTDAAYQAYAKEYARLGEKARQDTLGSAASLTGGYASSYAVSAAAQAQNDYNRQLTAVIPELQQAAYNKWSDKLNNQLNYTNLLMDADSESWNRWANNRDFAYQKKRDDVADEQWYKEYILAKKASESSGRSSSGGSRKGSKGGNADDIIINGDGDNKVITNKEGTYTYRTTQSEQEKIKAARTAKISADAGKLLAEARKKITATAGTKGMQEALKIIRSGKVDKNTYYKVSDAEKEIIIYKLGLNAYN